MVKNNVQCQFPKNPIKDKYFDNAFLLKKILSMGNMMKLYYG